jgi:neutral ceramidase
MRFVLVFCVLIAATLAQQTVLAGVSSINLGPPLGVPLGGYSAPPRRVAGWPIPRFTKYTAFMTPSEGTQDPIFAKCLALKTGDDNVIFMSLDAIGSGHDISRLSWEKANRRGLKTKWENVITGASHTHSSFGAVAKELLWSLAPATDIYQEKLAEIITDKMAECLLTAESRLAPSKVGVGHSIIRGITRNRRANISPHVNSTSVDPSLGVIKVDKLDGTPLATLWNFGVHGTCYGSSQMKATGDISGVANEIMEKNGLGIALYMNAASGDTAPSGGMCDEKPLMKGSKIFAEEVGKFRQNIPTVTTGEIKANSVVTNFGLTQMNLTFERVGNCTSGGFMNICSICKFFDCRVNLKLNSTWIENTPKFTGVRIKLDGKNYGFVTVPGEAVQDLGYQIKDDGKRMGFDQTFVIGYANNHMGYFTTEREYLVGGYESLLSFWGIKTGEMVRHAAEKALTTVKPTPLK